MRRPLGNQVLQGFEPDAHPRLQQVAHNKPDEQGEGGHHFKIEERFDPHLSHRLQVAVTGDAHHQGGKDEGNDQ